MQIADFTIDKDSPTFIIAELSANHNGSLQVAIDTIRAAAKAGADAIKLQTYTADTITLDCDSELFTIKGDTLWDGKTFYELYDEAHTPWEWHKQLFEVAKEEGLICFSSPFDKSAVDFLETLDTPAYKIASFEITDIPLIEYAASKGKPVIISTGIATTEDIEEALNACYRMHNRDVILLKCTSAYPAPLEEANLLTISDIPKRFDVIVGFSDHTLGTTSPIVAVSLGAKVIEKHFILDSSLGGPDAAFSLDPETFTQMVQAVRDTEKLLGKADYTLTDKAKKSKAFCRSLFVTENLSKGDIITTANVRSIRPGYGMHPKHLPDILGKKTTRDLSKGTPLDVDMME